MLLKKLAVLLVIGVILGASAVNAQDPDHDDHEVDLHNLPLGDGKVSTSPQRGYIWACQTQFNGGGAFRDGPWINLETGTWDATAKVTVDGAVMWDNYFYTIDVIGDQRIITGNGLPSHPTGIFPVQSSDDAYQYDRNPNSIQEQTISFTLPLNPTLAATPSCEGGFVGLTITGIPIFNGFDAEGRDAVAHEIQDDCDGHPQITGQYHYHSLSSCIEEMGSGEGHSALIGYALDGFGIFGYRGEDGQMLTNEDLDECHGHTHTIEWDGQQVEMYHYHTTAEFPYTVGCFRGTANYLRPDTQEGGAPPQGQNGQPPQGQGQAQNGQMPPPPNGGNGQGNPPPPPNGGQNGQPPPPPGQ